MDDIFTQEMIVPSIIIFLVTAALSGLVFFLVSKSREKKGLSKGQLSSLAGCDMSYIGKIERCEKFPNLKMIAKFIIALEINAKDLFDFE